MKRWKNLFANSAIKLSLVATVALYSSLLVASENTTPNYPDFINIYGVGKKIGEKSYNGVGAKLHNQYLEAVVEKSNDYTKLGVIGKVDIQNSGTYTKLGLSYLKLDHYKVGNYTINPKQLTFGGALGYSSNNFNIEWGYIHHKLTGAKQANTTAKSAYIEVTARRKTEIGQFDIVATLKHQKAYSKSKTDFKSSLAYYPIKDIELKTIYDSSKPYKKDNYNIKAGIKYTFGWETKGKFSPYVATGYSLSSSVKVEATYEKSIANRPLSWKDEFEDALFTTQIVTDIKVVEEKEESTPTEAEQQETQTQQQQQPVQHTTPAKPKPKPKPKKEEPNLTPPPKKEEPNPTCPAGTIDVNWDWSVCA